MRLAAPFLLSALLAAAPPAVLPWVVGPAPVPVAVSAAVAPTAPAASPVQVSAGWLEVRISADGAVQVHDGKGLRRFRGGLAGRPLKAWRDGGLPLEDPLKPFRLTALAPLQASAKPGPQGWLGHLEGLLWVVDDSEAVLSVLLPASGRLVHVRLPEADHIGLRFTATGLEVSGQVEGPEGVGPATWHLPWEALALQWTELRRPQPEVPRGTATDPFPQGTFGSK